MSSNISRVLPAMDVVLLDAVKSDTVNLTTPVRRIRANVAGAVKLRTWANNDVVTNFLAGETREIFARRIWATGTTATGLEGMV